MRITLVCLALAVLAPAALAAGDGTWPQPAPSVATPAGDSPPIQPRENVYVLNPVTSVSVDGGNVWRLVRRRR